MIHRIDDRTHVEQVIALHSLQKQGQIETLVRHGGIQPVDEFWIGIPDERFVILTGAAVTVQILVDDASLLVVAVLHVAPKAPDGVVFPQDAGHVVDHDYVDRTSQNIFTPVQLHYFIPIDRQVGVQVPFESSGQYATIQTQLESIVLDLSNILDSRSEAQGRRQDHSI